LKISDFVDCSNPSVLRWSRENCWASGSHFSIPKFVRCVRSGVNSTAAVADFYRRAHMLPRVTSSSGCCALRPRSWSRYNPHYISELRVSGMQRKHFKGSVQPTASRGPATVCLILWILAGSAALENSFHPSRVSPRAWPEYRWLSRVWCTTTFLYYSTFAF